MRTLAGNGWWDYSGVAPIGPAMSRSLGDVYDVIELPDGRIIFSQDASQNEWSSVVPYNRLMQLSTEGEISLFSDQVVLPKALALDHEGTLHVIDQKDRRIAAVRAGVVESRLECSTLVPEISTEDYFTGFAFDATGQLYVATIDRVIRVSPNGNRVVIAGKNGRYINGTTKEDGLRDIKALCVSPKGTLYILESDYVKRLTPDQLSVL